MRFRKKLFKGVSVSIGKKQSSINVGGFNIPIKGNKPTSQQTGSNSSSGCLNIMVYLFAAFLVFCVALSVMDKFKSPTAVVKTDSVIVAKKPAKKHHHKKRHKIIPHEIAQKDSILQDSVNIVK
jgi:hypothetical protein